jgi:uncharacterized phage protein gp47/JayE
MASPATKKTAKQISDLIISQLEAQLNQTIPLWPKAFNRVLAKVMGLVFVVLFQYAEYIALQMFIRFASDRPVTIGGIELVPLDEWGFLIGLERGTGQRAEAVVAVTVLTQSGTIQSGTQIVNPNNGEIYLVIGDTPLDAATVYPTIRAVNYAAIATLEAGQSLSFVSAPNTVEKTVVVTTPKVTGADPESTGECLQRQLNWWAARPQGGAYADYRIWGEEVEGVANIYPFSGGTDQIPTSGPGQADIYVEASDTVDGIAPQTLLDEVYENIERTADTGLADRRNMNTFVNTASIRRITIDASVQGLIVENESDVQGLIIQALTDYMLDRENFILGLSILPRKDIISETEAAGIVGRVVASQGGVVGSVTLSTGLAQSLIEGQKAKLGTVTWL